MSVLFIAVPFALAFAISAVIAFLWASRSGQLDDLETPPLRMLHDDGQQTAVRQERADEGRGTSAARSVQR